MDAQPASESLASMLSTCTTCRSWAEQDEGPYHRDAQPLRRDIVEDREGVALQLGIRLAGEGNAPVHGAAVEIWQCDALGRYSGFPPPDDSEVVTATSAPRGEYLADQTFLRGRQLCDDAGMVEFRTIYPGWYPGRTVHIHLMVHVDGAVLTSQLYFPDGLSDQVLARQPYARRHGRDTTNDSDEIFPTGGDPAILDVVPDGDGYLAAICLVIPHTRRAAATP
jgi:protocatechuate 3,4-dioxygenase beta subunit